MCKLLISVRSAEEAQVVLRHGVPFVDVKEPRSGSLGKADDDEIHRISRAAQAHAGVTVTAALGELREIDPATWRPVEGVAFYKLGLAGCAQLPWQEQLHGWRTRIDERAPQASLIAAAYADHHLAESPTPRNVLEVAAGLELSYFLIDTFDKRAGRLLSWLREPEIKELIDTAHKRGVRVALAGSLRLEELSAAAELGADILAVRGAVCSAAERNAKVDSDRVATACRFLAVERA